MTAKPAETAARAARDNPVLQALARVGYAVSGLLHALIGLIAIGVATGTEQGEADQSGALAQLAATPGGFAVLWVVVVGFAALGLWLVISAFLVRGGDAKKRAGRFVNDFAKGIVYMVLAVTALTFARGGSTDAATSSSDLSAKLLAAPGGVFLVALIGAAIVGVGIYFLVKGLGRRFTRDIDVPHGLAGSGVLALGIFGYVAKGVALCAVGILFLVAAITFDPGEATGLDGGLKAIAGLPYGEVVLIVVGAGLIAYGAYCVVRAFLARL